MKKKYLLVIGMLMVMVISLAGCSEVTSTQQDVKATMEVGNRLASNQPTPNDIDYSLERYNLIKRAYWVNGQREKADTLICEVEKPLGYIALFLENGACAGKFVVDGKVSSLNSYLTPDSEYYSGEGTCVSIQRRDGSTSSDSTRVNQWLPDVDGSYGANDKGIFFFTTDGKYVEWTGTYLYSDIPFEIKDTVVTYREVR